jgi:hypothetical protein
MISTKVRVKEKWIVVSIFHKDFVELYIYIYNSIMPQTNKEWQINIVKRSFYQSFIYIYKIQSWPKQIKNDKLTLWKDHLSFLL